MGNCARRLLVSFILSSGHRLFLSNHHHNHRADGNAWTHFTFDDSKSRAYRWGEDGIAGVSDSHARQCISFAFWNEKDDILKERLFGLGNPEGNHGESVKETYFYSDNTPTHSYMKYTYKYPQKKFPYEELRQKNADRSREEPEYSLIDTGIFEYVIGEAFFSEGAGAD